MNSAHWPGTLGILRQLPKLASRERHGARLASLQLTHFRVRSAHVPSPFTRHWGFPSATRTYCSYRALQVNREVLTQEWGRAFGGGAGILRFCPSCLPPYRSRGLQLNAFLAKCSCSTLHM